MTGDHETMQMELGRLRAEVEEVRNNLHIIHAEIAELHDAWRAATGLVKFVKLLAGVATAVGVLVAAYKGVSQ